MNKLHNLTRETAYSTGLSQRQSFMLFLPDALVPE